MSVDYLAQDRKELSGHRSLGVLMGGRLLDWVANPKTEPQRRIDSILQLVVQLRDLHRAAPDKHKGFDVLWQGKRFSVKRGIYSKSKAKEDELSARLNHCLERYKFAPMYWHQFDDRPIFGWGSELEKTPASDERALEASFSEGDAILCIMELARENLFKDLHTCDCGKWFFGRFIHQKFCSQTCQQKHHRSDPEYKEKRRVYMKNLRAMHKGRYFPARTAGKKVAAKISSSKLSSDPKRNAPTKNSRSKEINVAL
jgi:hypothetical protein